MNKQHWLFQKKQNRDTKARELRNQGFEVKKVSFRNQQLHPAHVEDSVDKGQVGFGNTSYNTVWPVLYEVSTVDDTDKFVVVTPACYSGTKTVSQYADKLVQYPKQMPNTKQAFAGQVFEVVLNGKTATLGELHEHGIDCITITAVDGLVFVKYFAKQWNKV